MFIAYLIAGCWFLLGRVTSLFRELILETIIIFDCIFIYRGCVPIYAGKFSFGESTLDPFLWTMIGYMA